MGISYQLTFAFLCAAFGGTAASSNFGPDESAFGGPDRVQTAVLVPIADAKLGLEAEAAKAIDSLTAAAVKKAASNPNPGAHNQAELIANARQLGKEITKQATDSGIGIVTSAIVTRALKKICPLWPFCD